MDTNFPSAPQTIIERDVVKPDAPSELSLSAVADGPPKKRGRKASFEVGDVVTCFNQSGEYVIMSADVENNAYGIAPVGSVDIVSSVIALALTKVKGQKKPKKLAELAVDDVVTFNGDLGKLWKITEFAGSREIAEGIFEGGNFARVKSLGSDEEQTLDISLLTKAKKRKSHNPSNPNDEYFTPIELASEACIFLKNTYGIKPAIILESSAGAGAFVSSARRVWPESIIVAVEVNSHSTIAEHETREQELTAAGADSVRIGRWEEVSEDPEFVEAVNGAGGVDLSVGNPPFKDFEDHVIRNLSLLKNDGLLVQLLRINALCGQDRERVFYSEVNSFFVAIHKLPERPSFTSDGKTDGAEYAVYVFAGSAGAAVEWRKKIDPEHSMPVIAEPIWYRE